MGWFRVGVANPPHAPEHTVHVNIEHVSPSPSPLPLPFLLLPPPPSALHSVKSRMGASESILYINVAKLVKWADFDSVRGSMSGVSGKLVRVWIKEFETALAVSEYQQ